MIDLSKYRIIDLSLEIVPGERKIDGSYLHGEPRWGRPLEVQEFTRISNLIQTSRPSGGLERLYS